MHRQGAVTLLTSVTMTVEQEGGQAARTRPVLMCDIWRGSRWALDLENVSYHECEDKNNMVACKEW